MKKDKLRNLFYVISLSITGLWSAVSLLQTITSVTIAEIFENRVFSSIVYTLFMVILIFKVIEQRNQLESEHPQIILGQPHVDERTVIIPPKENIEYSSQTGSYGGTISPYQPIPKGIERVEKYYFAHAVFSNKPMAGNARNVVATIEYFDSKQNQIPIYNFYGRWGLEKEQPRAITHTTFPKEQFRVDISPNGDKYELDLAMKHQNENFCFAFNDVSYYSVEFRKFEYILKDNTIYICVTLNGEKMIQSSYWFKLTNEGKNAGMKIQIIAAPK
jgi:hypothetical protein